MSVVSSSGITRPFDQDGVPYALFRQRTPALRSFRLTFPSDREVVLMQVLPGGTSKDLSPTADLGPANFPDGELHLAFQDSSPNPPGSNEFQYYVAHSLLSQPQGKRYQLRDVGCQGECSRAIPQEAFNSGRPGHDIGPHVIALTGFKMFFTGNRQHEIARVGVWFKKDRLHVALSDKNRDDVFAYLVDFVVIPTAGFNVEAKLEEGKGARGYETIQVPTPSHAHFVLTGWDFAFPSGDRELREIGVFRRDDDLTLMFRDDGANEPFDWGVQWAHISPLLVAAE